MRKQQSRYAITACRTVLARQAALAALVIAPTLTACGGTGDADVFGSATTQPVAATVATDSATTAPALAATEAPATTAAATVPAATEAPATTAAPTTVAPAPATGGTFPAAAELAVSFSFSPAESGRRIENPYVAVWVEDVDGNLVKTVSLWYHQSNKGQKWLADLRKWAAASDGVVDSTTTGATQVAGDYTVVWNGTGLDGAPVAQGEYVLFIEAAREHGPYEITSTPISIGNAGVAVTFDDNGELTNASAELRV